MEELTDKQEEALRAALSEGYYDVPRSADLETLTGILGIRRQAVSERLRRGTASLLQATLEDDDHDENIYYGVLNTDRDKLLESGSGKGIWGYRQGAKVARDNEFGGGEHLEVVEIHRVEE